MKNIVRKTYQAFTMIEMLVVVSIVVIMSVALFANYREIGDQGKISAFTGKVRADLYLAQNNSLLGKSNKYDANGWGVYFNRNLNKYVIFSDLNSNKIYDYPTKLLIHGTEWISGPNFTESSQVGNNVFVLNNATQVAGAGMPAGSGNGYWQFDGDKDSLSVADSVNFDFGSENFAMDMWIYADSLGLKKDILAKGSGGDIVYELYKTAADKIEFKIYDSDGISYILTHPNSISASTSVHLAVTRNAFNANNDRIRLFVNGFNRALKRISKTKAIKSLASNVIIGADNDGLTNSWHGRIDEIRISKGAGRWREYFPKPTAVYPQDDEFFREVKMPPGLVFDVLTLGGTATSELNIFFNKDDYLMYGNANFGNQEARLVINNAGTAGTGQAGDTAQTLVISPSGLINWTH